jgi:preprotein translocase subunit SecA
VYDEMATAGDDEASKSEQFTPDTPLSIPFKDLLHLPVSKGFVIQSGSEDADESDDNESDDTELSASSYLKFAQIFRQLLNEKYGHLPENFLFGKPVQEEEDRVVLLDDFQEINDFITFFSNHFQSTGSKELLNELQDYFKLIGHSKAEQLIINQVTMFCFHLIDSRIQSMETFEKMEKHLHMSLTSSYDSAAKFKSSQFGSELDNLLQKIHASEKDYTKCKENIKIYDDDKRAVYKGQLDLYYDILSFVRKQQWIDEKDHSNVWDCLQDTKKNHFSYLHEHIYRLGKLLSPLTQQYHVSFSDSDEHCIASVKMVAGTISGSLTYLKQELSSKSRGQLDEIRLLADTVLFGDEDISFEGMNVVCIAPKLEVIAKHSKLIVKTDGKPLDSIEILGKAERGKDGSEYEKAGGTGADGQNGLYGNAGGHIFMVANNLDPEGLVLSACGSKGHRGQDGGDGGDGWMPTSHGRDGKEAIFESGWLKNEDAVIINYGTYGESGGQGGNAGLGGAPGKSGISGRIEVLDLHDPGNCQEEQQPIDDADPGLPGNPGKGGKNTKHGKDQGAYAAKPGTWGKIKNFVTAGENRTISEIMGGLEHPAIKQDSGSGEKYERPGQGLPKQRKRSDHPDYKDDGRGYQGDGGDGKVKVNTALANEKRVINKQSCYQAMHQLCKQSLQHWNVGSHNQFMNAFAQKLGNTHNSSVFAALTHSDMMKANSTLWVERIQRQSEEKQHSLKVTRNQRTQVQTFLMKDFAEAARYRDLGYLGSASSHGKLHLLDLLPLKASAARQGVQLCSLSMETLLLSTEHDRAVEKLSELGQEFVVVCCKRVQCPHDFLIVKSSEEGTYHYCQHAGEFQITDPTVCGFLNSIKLQESQVNTIPRDDFLYPKMAALIHSQLGKNTNVPYTSLQFHCLQQLRLIVAIRKTYQVLGTKYIELPERQALRKLYGQYLDELLITESIESLKILESDMLADSLLILPLETSWIAGETERAATLQMLIEVFNQNPTLTHLLKVLEAFHAYHTENISQSTYRQVYLFHLNNLMGLKKFFSELHIAIQILCEKGRINEALGNVPIIASSEVFLHQITFPEADPTESNIQDFQRTMTHICEQPPLVYTVVNQHMDSLTQCVEDTLQIELPRWIESSHPPKDLTFEETYAAFEAAQPCIATISFALSVYAKCCATSLPTQHSDQLHNILEHTYQVIRENIIKINSMSSVDVLIESLGVNPKELYESVNALSKQEYPAVTALVHLLQQLCYLTTTSDRLFITSNDSCQIPPATLLTYTPNVLESIHEFCEKKLTGSKEESAELSQYICYLIGIHNALHQFPLACPVSALSKWTEDMMKIKVLKTRSKHSDIAERLEDLKYRLKHSTSNLKKLTSVNIDLQWLRYAENLTHYTKLNSTADDRIKLQCELALNQEFNWTGCIDTLCNWLCPGLCWLSPLRVTVVTKRLTPKHDVFIQNKQPPQGLVVVKETLYLYPGELVDQWWTAFQEPGNSLHIRVVPNLTDALLRSVLGQDVRQWLKSNRSLTVSEEKKACLLRELEYEDEHNIHHSASLNDHVMHNGINTLFSLIVVKTQACEIKRHYKDTNVSNIDFKVTESDIVIIQGKCNNETQRAIEYLLDITFDPSWLQDAAAMCLIRHPYRKLPTLQVVSNCGDLAEYKFEYRMPVVTNLSNDETQSLATQFKPMSDVLNYFVNYHQPMDILHSALQKALEQYTGSILSTEISSLVRALRFHFIQECLAEKILSSGPENFKTVQSSLKQLLNSHCESPLLEDMYLTGFESFLSFLLVQSERSKSSVASRIASMDEGVKDTHHQYWQLVMDKKTLKAEDVRCLCLAFAYHKKPKDIDNNMSVFLRMQTYTNITKGLCYLKLTQETKPGKGTCGSIANLLKQISSCENSCRLDALHQAAIILEDKRNLVELLEVIQSVEHLRKQLSNYLTAETLPDEEACLAILKDDYFYYHTYKMIISWCMEKQGKLVKDTQELVSDTLFDNDKEHRGKLVNTMSSWLIGKTEVFLSSYGWRYLVDLYEIGELICKTLKFGITSIHEASSPLEHSVLLHNCLTLVQVIDASSDITSVLTILEVEPSDKWFTYLFTQNFMEAYKDHFDVTSNERESYIREKLFYTDPKLIQILYNVFIDEQYNRENEDSEIGIISEAQLGMILDWLPFIESNPDTCSALCRTTMSMWEKELAEIHFKQYLDHWHGLSAADKMHITYLMNRVRLSGGKLEFISLLSVIKGKYISSKSRDSSPLISLVEDLYYSRTSLKQVNDVIQGYAYQQWSQQLCILKNQTQDQPHPRTVDQVLQLIEVQLQSNAFTMSTDTFDSIKTKAQEISQQVHDCKSQPPSSTERELNNFSEIMQRYVTIDERLQWLKSHHVEFVVHLIKAWMFVNDKQLPYNSQLVSLLLFLHTNEDGLLQEVKTGEGKTLIVAMLAAAKALLGFRVDVVSSNRDLAKDGVQKCKKYFHALGLEASVNCTDDDGINQQAYRSHIVYGDVGSFQRDVLTEETKPGGTTFSTRYSDLNKTCLIVDEVDSMFLDKGRHMLYISHESSALKHLEPLFLVIWSSVLGVDPVEIEEQAMVDQLLDQLAIDLNKLIQMKQITVPHYLIDFCSFKMKAWVRSAYQARFMEADNHFVLDQRNKEDIHEAKQIFPIDKQTGIEEYNMKWSNGLSQFLELKYRHALSTESLKAIFISNKRFFKRYGTALFGLTGTLGSFSSRKLLQEVYNIWTVELPTNRPKRFTLQKSHIATDTGGWCEAIYSEICERTCQQPILVICDSINGLNNLKSHFKKVKAYDNYMITDYARDGDNVEAFFEGQGSALPKHIVLATNKGGRGTDIKIKEDMVPGGLHVIVTFLPENTRIEEQAFGRAARAGQAGSGCLVLQIDPHDYKEEIQTFKTLSAAAETIIEMEKLKRDQGESERISQLLSEGIPQLDLEEGLYQQFQDHKKAFEASLGTASFFGDKLSGEPMNAIVAVLIDHWAYWLDSVHHKIQAADSNEKRQALMEEFGNKFPTQPQPPSLDDAFFVMPEHCIELGMAYIKEGSFIPALKWFEKAMDGGDCTGLSPMAACYCYIKSCMDDTNLESKKKTARHYLKKAKVDLNMLRRGWMANGEIAKSLVDLIDVSQHVHAEENCYAEQIKDKLKVIGLHLNTLDTLLGDALDESSFVNESKLDVEVITAAESKYIYQKLVNGGILCHHKVRKCWKRQEAVKRLIKDEVEPTIADGLISLIVEKANERGSISESSLCLRDLVYSSGELWSMICPLLEESENVMVLELSQVDEKVQEEASLKQSWKALKEQFNELSASTSESLVLSVGSPVCRKLDMEHELTKHLQTNLLYFETRRAVIKHDSLEQMKTCVLERYEMCKIKGENGKEQSLREYLVDLLYYSEKHDRVLYENWLPFDCQDMEVRKLHSFLQEKDILKSGLLAKKPKHSNSDEALIASAEETLKTEGYTREQMTIILNVLRGLRGQLRSFERKIEVGFVDFYSLEDRPDDVPETLDFFMSWHLDHFLVLKQKEKGWWDWNAFAVAMIGLAEVIAGAALIAFSSAAAASFGTGLIAEGISDMVYGTIAGITGTFSWKDYAIQKAFSVTTLLATGGFANLIKFAKTAKLVCSASRCSKFAKTIARAACKFALSVTEVIITDVVLAKVQKTIISLLTEAIMKKLSTHLEGSLRKLLTTMAKHETGNDTFHETCKKMKNNVEIVLEKKTMLPEAIDKMFALAVSGLQKGYKELAKKLGKSKPKLVKLVDNGVKIAKLVRDLYKIVEKGLNIAMIAEVLLDITKKEIEEILEDSSSHVQSHVDDEIIEQELDELMKFFRMYLHDQVQRMLNGVYDKIITGSLKEVARAGRNAVSTRVQAAFQGKKSSKVVKELQVTRNSQAQKKKDTSSNTPPKPSTHIEKKHQAFKQRREGFQCTVLKMKVKNQSRKSEGFFLFKCSRHTK